MKVRGFEFLQLYKHAHYGALLLRLSADDLKTVKAFIVDNRNLDKGQFVHSVNRMFIDKSKPKNWTLIMEILTVIA